MIIYYIAFNTMSNFISRLDLEARLEDIAQSPSQQGTVDLIVCRPQVNLRKELEVGELTIQEGLVGDNWRKMLDEGSSKYVKPDTQLALINSRVMAAIVNDKHSWQLAGDQFYVDFDLSKNNVPTGTRLIIGNAVIEVTKEPHLGCSKFAKRFGKDAVKFVNSILGQTLNLRGIYARVISPGQVRLGSGINKLGA